MAWSFRESEGETLRLKKPMPPDGGIGTELPPGTGPDGERRRGDIAEREAGIRRRVDDVSLPVDAGRHVDALAPGRQLDGHARRRVPATVLADVDAAGEALV